MPHTHTDVRTETILRSQVHAWSKNIASTFFALCISYIYLLLWIYEYSNIASISSKCKIKWLQIFLLAINSRHMFFLYCPLLGIIFAAPGFLDNRMYQLVFQQVVATELDTNTSDTEFIGWKIRMIGLHHSSYTALCV